MTRGRKPTITDEMYAAIPDFVAQGLTRDQIAERLGVKLPTLAVYCSKRKIPLALPKTRKQRSDAGQPRITTKTKRPDVEALRQVVVLHQEAKARGMTKVGLAHELLAIIVKDKLFDAVLGKIGEDA
jgi:hypothetical protein